MQIDGMTALVIGGGSGLGEATARHLAGLGAKLAIVDLSAARAEAVAAEIGGLGFAGDVSQAESLEAAFAEAREAQGPCRILVNCAGVGPSKRILDKEGAPQPLDGFAQVVGINLIGSFNALRLAAAEMAAAAPLDDGERGIVVNTASIAAFEGQVGQAAYAASKGGVHALTLPAARELARHGIRVNTIAPGVFWTPMFETVKPEWRQGIIDGIPFPKRTGQPEEFARLVQFLIENPMANGATYRLDASLRLA
ncbi:MAG: SDR family NAD(P)-dependent oxidoreductase [Rhodospirillales bacterium]